VVLATGVETPDLTRPLGFAPAIYPVKGYSGTWRITDPAGVPTLPFVDETELLAVANYGDRLRVTAIAEFAGRDRSLPADRVKLLDAYVRRSFGAAVDLDHPEFWTGLRPTTPAGPPYLGRVRRFENLWINAGHGQLGWTMSLGAAEILAQAMAGEPPALRDVSSRARWLEAL
jgi:D-amino-acid dehydrogenase